MDKVTAARLLEPTELLEYEYEPSNREKKLTPRKHGKFWCIHCDQAQVHEGLKCPVCKKRSGTRRLRK